MTPAGRRLLFGAGVAVLCVWVLLPVYLVALGAFGGRPAVFRWPKSIWPADLSVQAMMTFLQVEGVLRAFTNSLVAAGLTVLFSILLGAPAGYALARLRLPGAENLGIAIFLTYLVPPIILFIPLARVVGALGVFDSWWALVVVYPGFTIPFCTWKMMGYFKTVPLEVEEAAWLDGCSRLGSLCRIVLPVSRAGVTISAIFAFSLAMQEYLYAVAYVAPRGEKVVTVGLATALIRGDIFYWGSLMAGSLVVGLPIAILYSLVLDQFIEGLTGVGSSS